MPKFGKVAIVGVGLIGGSVGLAIRQRQLASRVSGIGRRRSSLERAQAVGAVDEVSTDFVSAVRNAEIVVVATPVARVADDVCRAAEVAEHSTLITDVGSAKSLICRSVDRILQGRQSSFVGSHPLAGDHRSGPENARADLFEGRKVVVTPTDSTAEQLTDRAASFWRLLGAQVQIMSPEEHDLALAATSHLPHLVAAALAACTPEDRLSLAATGWADTTRIASADPSLWTDIFAQNAPAVLHCLDALQDRLQEMRFEMEQSNWPRLKEILEQAKQVRDALGN